MQHENHQYLTMEKRMRIEDGEILIHGIEVGDKYERERIP